MLLVQSKEDKKISQHTKNWLTFELIYVLISGLAFGLTLGLIFGLTLGLIFGLIYGLSFGLIFILRNRQDEKLA